MCFPAVRLVLRIGAVQHRTPWGVFVGRQAVATGWIVDIAVDRAYGRALKVDAATFYNIVISGVVMACRSRVGAVRVAGSLGFPWRVA